MSDHRTFHVIHIFSMASRHTPSLRPFTAVHDLHGSSSNLQVISHPCSGAFKLYYLFLSSFVASTEDHATSKTIDQIRPSSLWPALYDFSVSANFGHWTYDTLCCIALTTTSNTNVFSSTIRNVCGNSGRCSLAV